MAGKTSSPVADFVSSLSREEIASFNGAELYKIIEFAVVHEFGIISANSTISALRHAVREWCAGALNDWDVLESSPWFYDIDEEKPAVRQFIARKRQEIAASRRLESEEIAREEVRKLTKLTDAELAEFFES
jgi:tRNA(Ile)-lysidine synthase TilS/MesJ